MIPMDCCARAAVHFVIMLAKVRKLVYTILTETEE